MTYGLDTSVVLRILTGRPQPLADIVSERIGHILEEGGDFFVADMAILEAYHALQHFYGSTKEEAVLALRSLAQEPGFAVSPEAMSALDTPNAWKASPGMIDRMIANGYAAKGYVTVSCEKSFSKLDLTEVIK